MSFGRVVADVAVGLALDEARAAAAAGARHRLVGRGVDRLDVHAIDGLARHAVGIGAGVDGHFDHRLDRRGDGVLVVLTDKDDRELPDRREIHRLVEETVVDAAVAKEAGGNPILAARFEGKGGTTGHRHAGSDNAVCAVNAQAHVGDVHGAAATLL